MSNRIALCLISFLLAILTGCAGPQSAKYASSVGRATGHLEAAESDVEAAKPHADQVGKAHLNSASDNLKVVSTQMPVMQQAVNDLAKTQEELKDEQNRWVGYKARAFLKTALVGAGIVVVLMVLFAATGFAGPVGAIAAIIFHSATGCLVLLSTRLKAVVERFAAPKPAN